MESIIVTGFETIKDGISSGLVVTICAGIGGWLLSLGIKVFRIVGG